MSARQERPQGNVQELIPIREVKMASLRIHGNDDDESDSESSSEEEKVENVSDKPKMIECP